MPIQFAPTVLQKKTSDLGRFSNRCYVNMAGYPFGIHLKNMNRNSDPKFMILESKQFNFLFFKKPF